MASCFLQTPDRQRTNPRSDTTEEVRRQIRRERNENLTNVNFVIDEFMQLSMEQDAAAQVSMQLAVLLVLLPKFWHVDVFEKLFLNQNLIKQQTNLSDLTAIYHTTCL